jgi:hypothetical protein
MINLNQYQKIKTDLDQNVLIHGDLLTAKRINSQFPYQVNLRFKSADLIAEEGFLNNNLYLTFSKHFNKQNLGIFAFRILPFNPLEIYIESLYFEKNRKDLAAGTLKNLGSVLGNITLGFIAGRSIYDEIDLVKKIGRTVKSASMKSTRIDDKYRKESNLFYQSLIFALYEAIKNSGGSR